MTVMTFAMGAAQDETIQVRAMLRSGLNAEEWQQRQAPYMMSLVESGEFPYLKRVVVDAEVPHEGSEAIFERSLHRLVGGIAATLPPGSRPRGERNAGSANTADDMAFAACEKRRR